jgi:hypothetical protein
MAYVKYYPICIKKNGKEFCVDLDHLDRFGELKPFVGFYLNYVIGDKDKGNRLTQSLKFMGLGSGDFKADVKNCMDKLGLTDFDFLTDFEPHNLTDAINNFVVEMEKLGYKYIEDDFFYGVLYADYGCSTL